MQNQTQQATARAEREASSAVMRSELDDSAAHQEVHLEDIAVSLTTPMPPFYLESIRTTTHAYEYAAGGLKTVSRVSETPTAADAVRTSCQQAIEVNENLMLLLRSIGSNEHYENLLNHNNQMHDIIGLAANILSENENQIEGVGLEERDRILYEASNVLSLSGQKAREAIEFLEVNLTQEAEEEPNIDLQHSSSSSSSAARHSSPLASEVSSEEHYSGDSFDAESVPEEGDFAVADLNSGSNRNSEVSSNEVPESNSV